MKDTAANLFVCLLLLLALHGADVAATEAFGPVAAEWLADDVGLLAMLFFAAVMAIVAKKSYDTKARNKELQAKLAEAQDLLKRMSDHIERHKDHYRGQE